MHFNRMLSKREQDSVLAAYRWEGCGPEDNPYCYGEFTPIHGIHGQLLGYHCKICGSTADINKVPEYGNLRMLVKRTVLDAVLSPKKEEKEEPCTNQMTLF